MQELASYSIGQTASRTGLSTHTIRKWEDRYDAVCPQRSAGGTRRYSAAEVERLALLKVLVDDGHGIGSIAMLETEKLKQLRAANVLLDGPLKPPSRKTVVFGTTLPILFEQNRTQMPGLEIVAAPAVPDEAASDADVVVLEMPTLSVAAMDRVDKLRQTTGARCVIVAYRYAPIEVADRFASQSSVCLRMPLDFREVQRAVDAMLGEQGETTAFKPAPRRFAQPVVARVAAMQPALGCECPRHVAELVSALMDFEAYSEHCESANAQEASLHNYLNIAASHARASLEAALAALAEYESIPLAQWQTQHETTVESQHRSVGHQ